MATFYRAENGFWHDRETTVRDVVLYETVVLENDLAVSSLALEWVGNLSARNTLWVYPSREQAAAFAHDFDYEIEAYDLENFVIVAVDGDGGMLLWFTERSEKSSES